MGQVDPAVQVRLEAGRGGWQEEEGEEKLYFGAVSKGLSLRASAVGGASPETSQLRE